MSEKHIQTTLTDEEREKLGSIGASIVMYASAMEAYHYTKLTPMMLMEQREELLKACRVMIKAWNCRHPVAGIAAISLAYEKVTGLDVSEDIEDDSDV